MLTVVITFLDKLDESYEDVKDERARVVITNVLKDVSDSEQLAYQPYSPTSDPSRPANHFEELKSKQKQEQTKFFQKLMSELQVDQKPTNVNTDKKFYNVDAIQDEPVLSHTYDPIKPTSPIPKKHETNR